MKNDKNPADTVNLNEVEITSVYFSKSGDKIVFNSVPKQLIYKGRRYILAST